MNNRVITVDRKNELNICEWGVFIENEIGETYEVALPQDLQSKVSDFLHKRAEDKDIVGLNTNNKIEW
jgi:hypothetical protein